MQEFMEMEREGLSTQAISELMGCDRKTVRKYLREPEAVPNLGRFLGPGLQRISGIVGTPRRSEPRRTEEPVCRFL